MLRHAQHPQPPQSRLTMLRIGMPYIEGALDADDGDLPGNRLAVNSLGERGGDFIRHRRHAGAFHAPLHTVQPARPDGIQSRFQRRSPARRGENADLNQRFLLPLGEPRSGNRFVGSEAASAANEVCMKADPMVSVLAVVRKRRRQSRRSVPEIMTDSLDSENTNPCGRKVVVSIPPGEQLTIGRRIGLVARRRLVATASPTPPEPVDSLTNRRLQCTYCHPTCIVCISANHGEA